MAIITGGNVIEGARQRSASGAASAAGEFGPFVNAGAPTDGGAGTQKGVAAKGALLVDATNANLYINAGTLASPIWKLITRAA